MTARAHTDRTRPAPRSPAQALIAAFAEHAADGWSSFRLEGGMVDAPHLARAHRLLARAGSTDPNPAEPSG